MVERRGGLGFTFETFVNLRIRNQMWRNELKRDFTLELEIGRFPYLSHASGAELLKDLVVADGLADHDEPILPCSHSHLSNTRSNWLIQML